MNQKEVEKALSDLPLSQIRYYDEVGSTNDLAAEWAAQDAPDLALVIADEQTRGRGRSGKTWYTPAGAGLAFSLVLRPGRADPPEHLPRLAGLGALAISQALKDLYQLRAEIKWPNDVLVGGSKLAGILAEAHWTGNQIDALILGIGINIAPQAIPPAAALDFPATSIESVIGRRVDRLEILNAVLQALLRWREALDTEAFIHAWEESLAYLSQPVQVSGLAGGPLTGTVAGLDEVGQLRLRLPSGETVSLQAGNISVRPVDTTGE